MVPVCCGACLIDGACLIEDACLIDGAASPLEGYELHEWVSFERALVVRDIFTGGVRTFLSTEDAQAFRASMYKQYSKLPRSYSVASHSTASFLGCNLGVAEGYQYTHDMDCNLEVMICQICRGSKSVYSTQQAKRPNNSPVYSECCSHSPSLKQRLLASAHF